MHWITHLDGGPKRVNHAAVSINHKIYSFGGYCTGENSKVYTSMDVHVLNTFTNRWTKHPVSDLPYFENDDILPFKRYGHTAIVYGDKIYIWGGRNDRLADGTLFCFDTKWHCWTAPKTSGMLPLARDGHTACLWRNRMIIYGGYEEESDNFADGCYALDLDTMEWKYLLTFGSEPVLRDFHTCTILGNKMYLFGGRSTAGGEEFYPNLVHVLDLVNLEWTTIKNVDVNGKEDQVPCGRRSHSAFVYNEKMYIYGGYNALKHQHFNDLYEFDPFSSRWRKIVTKGQKPCERRRQACVRVGGRLYMFGGTSPQKNFIAINNHSMNMSVESRDDEHFNDEEFAENRDDDDEREEDLHDHDEVEDDRLIDHCDMYILEFTPTLKTMCILALKKSFFNNNSKLFNFNNLNINCTFLDCLPKNLKIDILNMFMPNKITVGNRPTNSAG